MELSDEQIQASAAKFLIDGSEEDAASVLLACSLSVWESGDTWWVGDEVTYALHVALTGPRAAYEAIGAPDSPVQKAIGRAIQAVLPAGYYVKHLTAHVESASIDEGWRIELLEIARGTGVHNQAVRKAAVEWKYLRFRSKSEARIAQALDAAGALFLPNCMARVGPQAARATREPDFLVCYGGKWGVLEVDGEPFHPPTRTVQDHERDRLFKGHGIRVVEHFDATACYQTPDKVVAEFLAILRNA